VLNFVPIERKFDRAAVIFISFEQNSPPPVLRIAPVLLRFAPMTQKSARTLLRGARSHQISA
jgi:hypothetical protein